jgi:ATP-dependent DNA helicase
MDVNELSAKGLDPAIAQLLRARGITRLNDMQVGAVEAGLLSGENILVSAPTSAGKTLVGELAAARHAGTGLTVFLCSHKALASQVHGIFATRYLLKGTPYLKAGILTGDLDTVRGEWARFDVVVATYEKLYNEIVGGGRSLQRLRAVVVDEVQIVGEEERGPTLELLLARLRRRSGSPQIVGLSATVPNFRMLSDWLDATPVRWAVRTPPLEHEIWVPNERHVFRNGSSEPERLRHSVDVTDTAQVVGHVLEHGGGPLAIMAMTRPAASQYAEQLAETRPTSERIPHDVLDEFRGMGRDPELTERLCACLMKGIGVHHADLTPEQRRVVEDAFSAGHLDILVATPTLVAGVNLPIRTVVYPKLVRWNGSEETPISRSEYTNGAGRAGRQGMHEAGTSVMLAESLAVARELRSYVGEDCDPVVSRLGDRTREYRFLHILMGSPDAAVGDLASVAEGTLWARENGYGGLGEGRASLEGQLRETLGDERWGRLWTVDADSISPTRMGRAVAASGLEPAEALEALEALRRFEARLQAGETATEAVRHFVATLCTGAGMNAWLPYPSQRTRRLAGELSQALENVLPGDLWTACNLVAAAQALAAIGDDSIPAGLMARMAPDRAVRTRVSERLAWLTAAACAMAEGAAPAASEASVALLELLADQLKFQVEARAVPIERLFAAQPVRHVGPAKRLKLVDLVGQEVGEILTLQDGALRRAVGERQVEGVRRAALSYLDGLTREQSARQLAEAEADPATHAVVRDLLRLSGTAFHAPVETALRSLGWNLRVIAETGSEAKADLDGNADDGASVVIECKTTENLAGEISAREALDVTRKVTTIFEGHVLTIGRPVFSAAAIERVVHHQGPRVRLVTAGAVVELLLACRLRGLPPTEAGAMLRRFAHIDVSRVRAELAAHQ